MPPLRPGCQEAYISPSGIFSAKSRAHNPFALRCYQTTVQNRTELAFTYDRNKNLVRAACTKCGKVMPMPESKLLNLMQPADVIAWVSQRYVEHLQSEHSSAESADRDR